MTTHTPLVDVTIATYNHAKFIAQTIESVLSQKTNFEYRLIIGDDCSTDGTQEIIKSYAQQYPDRITTLLYSQHRGFKTEERVGIQILKLATSRYVALLDGDDYWSNPLKLQRQVDFLESHPECAICFHNVKVIDESKDREAWNFNPPDQKEISSIEDLLCENFLQTCSVMYRNGLIGTLPPWFHSCEMGDWLLHVMNAQHGSIGYLPEVMAVYRMHAGGTWTSADPARKYLEAIKAADLIDSYLNFKYKKVLKGRKAKLYQVLAGIYYRAGELDKARAALRKAFACRFFKFVNFRMFLMFQAPTLYEYSKRLWRPLAG